MPCLASQGADLQSPTMFVTHFTDVSHCNDFSLARDDERWPAYNDLFLDIYRLSRCKLSVVRRETQTLELHRFVGSRYCKMALQTA